jgi:3-dehydroquinate synthase
MNLEDHSASFKTINVDLGDRTYPIYIGQGLIERAGEMIRGKIPEADKIAVISTRVINDLHGYKLKKSLEEAEIDSLLVLVKDGEEAKSWSEAGNVTGELLEIGLDRQSAIIAFGGGTVGDLAGFVSSILLRGLALIQIPTTLLSQVDSSIGGKTAVNHPKGKNLIGSFYQPKLVISDPVLLETLPRKEFVSGLGEVVKYGVIADLELFERVENEYEKLIRQDQGILEYVVARCSRVKARMVSLDEQDRRGIRVALNYGHTVGHALEILTSLKISHGEAVAIGMEIAARISEKLGLMKKNDVERQSKALEQIGLEAQLPRVDLLNMIELMKRDKKATGKSINFVLPTGIGTPPVLKTVLERLIIETLENIE